MTDSNATKWKGHHADQVIIDEAGDLLQIGDGPPEIVIVVDEFTTEFRDATQRAYDNAIDDALFEVKE